MGKGSSELVRLCIETCFESSSSKLLHITPHLHLFQCHLEGVEVRSLRVEAWETYDFCGARRFLHGDEAARRVGSVLGFPCSTSGGDCGAMYCCSSRW